MNFKQLFITSSLLASFIESTYASETHYMQALLDDSSMKTVAQIRQAGVHNLGQDSGMVRKLLTGKDNQCIDMTQNAHHQPLHVSLNRFNPADRQDEKLLITALNKVLFSVTGVNYSFGKYCVLTLDSRYTIDPLAEISLFPEEKKILEKYIPKGPHISLFKWLTEESKATFDKKNKENQENANYILTDTKKIGSDWKKIK